MNQKEKRKTPNMHLQCTPTPRPRRERNWPPQTNPRAADQTHPVDMGNEWFSILVLLTWQPAQAISGVYHSLANGPITFLRLTHQTRLACWYALGPQYLLLPGLLGTCLGTWVLRSN